jgi:hypothetical protein
MPRATHAQGRPGTPVIPTDWAATHQVPAQKTMVGATATLRNPGTVQAWSVPLEQMVAVPKTPYAVDQPCRALALSQQAKEVVAADDPETVADYLIVVPAALEPAEKDLVTIACPSDPLLDGRVLEVQQVVRGSIRWERDLMCNLVD